MIYFLFPIILYFVKFPKLVQQEATVFCQKLHAIKYTWIELARDLLLRYKNHLTIERYCPLRDTRAGTHIFRIRHAREMPRIYRAKRNCQGFDDRRLPRRLVHTLSASRPLLDIVINILNRVEFVSDDDSVGSPANRLSNATGASRLLFFSFFSLHRAARCRPEEENPRRSPRPTYICFQATRVVSRPADRDSSGRY